MLEESERSSELWIDTLENGDRVGAVCLNHINIDSVAYFYDSFAGYKVDISKIGNNTGKWISDLLNFVVRGELDRILETPFGKIKVENLKGEYLIKQDNLLMCYITDIGFTKDNINILKSWAAC